ncbi:hypothetical protein HFP15_40030 [Amycolatopsis sp. K13G38]|uniref:Uncharacterized protein n=1 Tax=Amycolatopsis acididurans TaxID=2724524 RepID=A0ABX1JKN1_9PSEU|nr:hypothetical protein [Amycolatopsis acididurans]NKQ59050.1 hypothetical protein [Amycolatopsis acididurans]
MTSDGPDFAVLHPDGRLEYGRLGEDGSAYHAVKPYIDDVSSQGMGRLRAWFSDGFGGLPPNPLADRVLSSVGYHHPTGWRGTVALSMEEDQAGEYAPLPTEVRATLDELAAG